MSNTLKPASIPALLLSLFLCLYTPPACAVTIETHFIGGTAPANTAGRGDLDKIMETAARIWESAFSDPLVITIYYGWDEVGDAGTHTLQTCDSLGREITGIILFDNTGSVSFYLDPTPDSNEEYIRRSDEYQDLGGGMINVARVFSNPTGEAARHLDLLSVALHEIGHALGLSSANARFLEESADGAIVLRDDLPFVGTVIPLAYNKSGIVAHFDAEEIYYGSLMIGLNGDERRMPSELDIVANAQVSGFTPAAQNALLYRDRGMRVRGTFDEARAARSTSGGKSSEEAVRGAASPWVAIRDSQEGR